MIVAAATGVADVLVALFVVLLAAKLGDELFKRLGQPALVGEILAMVLLAVAVGVAAEGGVDLPSIGIVVALAVGFVVFVAVGGTRLVARWPDVFHAPKFSESPLLPAVILCLGLAAYAAQIGLAAIIGAFLAGMVVAETNDRHDFEEEVAPLCAFFPPFFFVFIGLEVQYDAFTDLATDALLVGVSVLAFATKFGAARVAARPMGRGNALVIGLGMVPRGEVGIIVAGIGATTGVVEPDLFAVIVGMSIATTLLIPPLLRRALARIPQPMIGAS